MAGVTTIPRSLCSLARPSGCHGVRKQYGRSLLGLDSGDWRDRGGSGPWQWPTRRHLRGREAGAGRCGWNSLAQLARAPMESSVDEEALHQLYLWVDSIPLSRPKRNLCRDFSDGVLVAEVVKFYFPKMVEMHNYVPANSLQQKLSNWGHLNRKVLNKLNLSVPEDVMRRIAQCAPGVVELVLIPLRQRLEERKRRRKQGSGSLQELAPQDGSGYMDVGLSQKARAEGAADPQVAEPLKGGRQPAARAPGYSQVPPGDPSFVLQMAEKEQELLASQETVQMKVRRLEHLLQLKNVRIDDLSRRLQQAERKHRRTVCLPEPGSHLQGPGKHPQALPDPGGLALALPVLGPRGQPPGLVRAPRTGPLPSPQDSRVPTQPSSQCSRPGGKLPSAAEGFPCLPWDPSSWRGRGERWAQPGVGRLGPRLCPLQAEPSGDPFGAPGAAGQGCPIKGVVCSRPCPSPLCAPGVEGDALGRGATWLTSGPHSECSPAGSKPSPCWASGCPSPWPHAARYSGHGQTPDPTLQGALTLAHRPTPGSEERGSPACAGRHGHAVVPHP
ncbi:sperm flagellar protein 1 isoform X2 [Dasypus novemcinctus]|uniref:sperm flagellar protein 1 isoform X2 n=1 Tax=Dasypus novemcinctus TaxID=9361 RepID=UPI002660547A|nr:sperm flagellar protein 1 isoform X2 [Dasypus novemcinctus]